MKTVASLFSFYLFSVVFKINLTSSVRLDYSKTEVWGPGLHLDSQLPSRYVFVQLYWDSGERVSVSQGQLQVSISASNNPFRGRVSVVDRKDGSYVIHYRPNTPNKDVGIEIKIHGKHLAKSPYKISGWMYQENCNCPMENEKWLEALQCPDNFTQLDNDFKLFKKNSIDMRVMESEVHKRWPKRQGSGALMHYVIKGNRIYRKDIGTITDFKMFSDSIFLSLARKVHLPDVELFINLGDWPLVKKSEKMIPILSWCGSADTKDIILPTYDVTDASIKSLGGVSIDLISVQGETGPVWSEKTPKGLFRGRDSRQERLDLAKLSRKGNNSELIDAAITAFFFFPEDKSLKEDRMSFFDFFKYKYQINVDGTVAAYRLPYLLSSDSVVLKQESPYFEHFYADLKPWVHYIPLKRDLSDVIEKITWAKDHDEEARLIALTAQKYMRESVTPGNIFCYYYTALKRLSESLKSSVQILEGMEEAQHPDYMAECNCHRKNKKTEL